jgi:hypothetical protein
MRGLHCEVGGFVAHQWPLVGLVEHLLAVLLAQQRPNQARVSTLR